MSKHTAIPWRFEGRYLYGSDRKIAEVPQGFVYQSGVDRANGQFIIRAVNSHPDLLAALERAVEWGELPRNTKVQAEAAIAKAKKVQP